MNNTVWTPPDHPNPHQILHSAVDDRLAGNYDVALAKHIWFHRYAKEFQRGLSGVRLSFALGYWLELANLYPPAHAAFLKVRDDTVAAFQQNIDDFDLFHDLASLNRTLNDQARTAIIFLGVAEKDFDAAERLYHVAERYLVAAGCYAACNPFLDPPQRLEIARKGYDLNKLFEASRPADSIVPRLARKHYLEDIGTLIALLELNQRPDEARCTWEMALSVVDDDDSKRVLAAALAGHPPAKR